MNKREKLAMSLFMTKWSMTNRCGDWFSLSYDQKLRWLCKADHVFRCIEWLKENNAKLNERCKHESKREKGKQQSGSE